MMEDDLDALRERIRAVDAELVALAADRVRLARAVGAAKRAAGLPTVDYDREREVLEHARGVARERGLDQGVAEELLARLIRAAVTVQEEDRVRGAAVGAGQDAVVVGGAGRMGGWFVRFLGALGYRTAVLDPAAPPGERAEAVERLRSADLVLCATPPGVTAALYRDWLRDPPRGVVADIASVKTPLRDAIRALRAAGARVGSLHPMFGPATVLLRDADVVLCDTGDPRATAAIRALFAPTTARLVTLPLEEHDRLMADLLALAHATAIGFALALPAAAHPIRSTTFQALERLAAAAVRESPGVYYEIQAANPHAPAALARLRAALDGLTAAVARADPEAFADLMADGRRRTPEP